MRIIRPSFKLLLLLLCMVSASTIYAQDKVAVNSILKPLAARCITYPYKDTVTVKVANLTAAAITNIPVYYSVNGGTPVSGTLSNLPASGTANYTFTTQLNITSQGVYDIKIYTALSGDNVKTNDTLVTRLVTVMNTFPYRETFEKNDGGMVWGGTNATWKWGIPAKGRMNSAPEGFLCWTEGSYIAGTRKITGNYAVNCRTSYVEFPCFDFSKLKHPYIWFWSNVSTESGWEIVDLQYSYDDVNWAQVGSTDPSDCNTNSWYSNGSGWTGSPGYGCQGPPNCGAWAKSKHCIDWMAGQSRVYLRFIYTASGTTATTDEGLGFDDVNIGEVPAINLNVSATKACVNNPVYFKNGTDPCLTDLQWDFGDGSGKLKTNNPIHIYRKPGTYTAKVTIKYGCSSIDSSNTVTVNVLPGPTVSLSGLPKKICANDLSVVHLAGRGSPPGGVFGYLDDQDNFFQITDTTAFIPASLGIGKQRIVYSYTGGTNNCPSYDTANIDVYLPNVQFSNLGGSYCVSTPAFTLKGTPAGGTFTVDGNAATSFNPGTIGKGTHTVIYTYADPQGCTATAAQIVSVVDAIQVHITNLANIYCKEAAAVTLTGTPINGTFTIDKKNAAILDPAALDTGMHKIKYTYFDNGSCGGYDSLMVRIIQEKPAFSGLKNVYCKYDAAITLKAIPTGGTFKIDNAVATKLTPGSLSLGNHTVSYTYSDPFGCSATIKQTVQIDKPTVQILSLLPNDTICRGASLIPLIAQPSGGNFLLDGAAATSFDPSTLALGAHTVKYYYINPLTGCGDSSSVNVALIKQPVVQMNALKAKYCTNEDPVKLTGTPVGGIFRIDGVQATEFDPSRYTLNDPHIIEYDYLNQYGCAVSVSKTVIVKPLSIVSITGLKGPFCKQGSVISLSGSPAGGTFMIDGKAATLFDPSALGEGQHSVNYNVNDSNGCINTVMQIVDVIAGPNEKIVPHTITICDGDAVELNFASSSPFKWSTGATSQKILVKPHSTTKYWVAVSSCTNYSDSAAVIVNPRPHSDFDLSQTQGTVPQEIKGHSTATGYTNIKWVVNDSQMMNTTDFIYTFLKSGNYTVKLIAENDYGCRDTSVKILVLTNLVKIEVPNVFSPDGDGINEDFGINHTAVTQVTNYEFKIFNRWGNELFTTTSPENRWDGSYNGSAVAEGAYFYLLNAKMKDGSDVKLSGSVTIVRRK